MTLFRLLGGLPPYGPPAHSLPRSWAHRGGEGTVVEFTPPDGPPWTANFAPGGCSLDTVVPHPDGRQVIVVAKGAGYILSPLEPNEPTELSWGIHHLLEVPDQRLVVVDQGETAFIGVGPDGVRWRSARVSWDGFAELALNGSVLSGTAYDPTAAGHNQTDPAKLWVPFALDLRTGASQGGSYTLPDRKAKEQLASFSAV